MIDDNVAAPTSRVRTLAAARHRLHPLILPGGIAALAAGFVGYVASVDPNEAGHYPTCPFLYATDLYCPGCGSLRMFHALGNGDIAEAFGRNPFAFLMVPLLVFFWARWTVARARGMRRTTLAHPAWLWTLFAAIVIFWVVRNLPFGHPLAP